MSVIVISSDSPTFVCSSPACYIDAESIDTSFVYDSEYESSCDVNDTITVIGGGEDGTDGSDGADGRGIVDIVRTAGDGSAGTTDTYTISYTIAPLTNTYDVVMGTDGSIGDTGLTGDTGATGSIGANGVDGADGATITADTSDPTILNPGNDGDLHIRTSTYDLYERVAGAWGIIGNVQGAAGNDGDDGDDGIDGDQWSYGATVPTSSTVNTFDAYYLYTVNNTIYYKAESDNGWNPITNINGNVYKTTSSTSVNLTSTIVGDTVILTVDSELAYTTGQFVVVANSITSQFTGTVTSYTGTTLTLVVTYIIGTTTLTSWDVNLAGVVASNSVPQWYTITATSGTGSIASRTFVGPSGWTINSSDNISVTGLGSSALDLTIKHATGLYAVEVVIFNDDGTKYTKARIPVSYAEIYEDLTHVAIELESFCTLAQDLVIHVKLQ